MALAGDAAHPMLPRKLSPAMFLPVGANKEQIKAKAGPRGLKTGSSWA